MGQRAHGPRYRPGTPCVLAALGASLGVAAPRALAQGDPTTGCWTQPCENDVGCAGVGVGPFEPDGFAIDRRPAIELALRNANPASCVGLTPGWWDDDFTPGVEHDLGERLVNGAPTGEPNGVPDTFDWLIERMEHWYARGYRRIVLRLPAGSVPGRLLSPMQWWTMPPWKRDGFENHVRAWIRTKALAGDPVSVELYTGFLASYDPCELFIAPDRETFDIADHDHMCSLLGTTRPWMDVGLSRVWFDATATSGARIANVEQLNADPDYRDASPGPMRFGVEPLPTTGVGFQRRPDPAQIRRVPFYMATSYYQRAAADPGFTFARPDWALDPGTTEVLLRPTLERPTTLAQWRNAERAGYVIVGLDGDDLSARAPAYILGCGVIDNRSDFNLDGFVNETDLFEFFSAFFPNQGRSAEEIDPVTGRIGYVDGDVNADGYVNATDWFEYINWWFARDESPIDFGACD